MIRRPPRSTPKPSSAASDVYKRQETSTASLQVARNILMNNRDLAMENGEIVSQVPKNDNVRGAGEYSIVMELYANDGKEEQA